MLVAEVFILCHEAAERLTSFTVPANEQDDTAIYPEVHKRIARLDLLGAQFHTNQTDLVKI